MSGAVPAYPPVFGANVGANAHLNFRTTEHAEPTDYAHHRL